MVANNNLNIRGDDANDVVSAEALMMLKEHIAETYGCDPLHDRHRLLGRLDPAVRDRGRLPGLLDGIQPNCSFQDSWTTANEVNDCHLLRHYFNTAGGFTAAQQAAVMDDAGHVRVPVWDLSFAPVGIPSRVQNCNLQGTPLASARVRPGRQPGRSALRRPGLPVRDLGLPAERRLRPQPVRQRRRRSTASVR